MTSCTKSKRTSSPDAPAKCRDVENASAFLARVQSLPAHVQCSREKSFNFGCVIHFTLQCSSSRLSETSGQYRIGDHYRAVAQKHGDLVVWFWIGTHEEYNNFIKQLR